MVETPDYSFSSRRLFALEPSPLDASRPTKLIPEEANISVGNPHTCDMAPPKKGPIPPDKDIDE
jgi:hypothetical protein